MVSKKRYQFSAYSLLYAVLILLLVVVFGMLFMEMRYHSEYRTRRLLYRQELRENIRKILRERLDEIWSLPKKFTLKEYPNTIFYSQKNKYGVFDQYTLKAEKANIKESHTVLIGRELTNVPALYFLHPEELKIGGHTKVSPSAYITKAGVKRAYVDSKSGSSGKLIDGKITNIPYKGNSFFEEIEIRKDLENLLKDIQNKEWEEYNPDSVYEHSFSKLPRVLFAKDSTYIENDLSGNIILVGDTSLTISSNLKCSDIIIAAPNIYIEPYFRGNIQLFSSNRIIIKESVNLLYPSLVYIQSKRKENALIVESNTQINGVVFTEKTDNRKHLSNDVILKKNTLINGYLINRNANLYLKGNIYGSVFSNNFHVNNQGSIHSNLLLNTIIDQKKMNKFHYGIFLPKFDNNKRIIQWLE
jgi:hypothetical protein